MQDAGEGWQRTAEQSPVLELELPPPAGPHPARGAAGLGQHGDGLGRASEAQPFPAAMERLAWKRWEGADVCPSSPALVPSHFRLVEAG